MSSLISTNSASTVVAASVVSQQLYLTEPGDMGPISPTDVIQGSIGDCFLLAAIAEEAYWAPSLISNTIQDNGNGTQTVNLYTVTGYSASAQPILAAAPVTVLDATLPSYGAKNLTVGGVTEIWPQVLEAAYAQANGGYSAIGSGYPFSAMMQLTGCAASPLNPNQVTEANLINDRAAGDLITLDTSATGSLAYGLVNSHAYFYEGLRTVNGTDYVAAGNPWGYDQPALIPVSNLSSAFDEIDVGSVPASAPGSSIVTPVPPIPTPGSGLVVDVSEDAWEGDAQFTVTVDGSQVGGTLTATALHAAGQSQAITIGGILAAGQHLIGITFINDAYGGSSSMDRNLYVTGASYNGVAIAGAAAPLYNDSTDTFSLTASTPTTPTPTPTPIPTPTPSGTGLVVNVAEDAYQGDAQFTVSIDGQQVGGTYTATASNAAGQSQVIAVDGSLSNGPHTIGISFINDAYGGSPSMDRNLYVTGASYNGVAITGAAAPLYSNSTDTFGVTVGTPVTSTAVINVAEDAYQGDAQFTVSVDGKQYGGTYTVTASHAAGQSQAITISGIPENFTPHDLAVTFLNDAYGGSPSLDRNLYVNSVQFDGQAIPGASAALYTNSTQHFTVTVPSNYTG